MASAVVCFASACVWIRLLRKVNLPSWFNEITYWLTYCSCLKNKTNQLNSCVCVWYFFSSLLWLDI